MEKLIELLNEYSELKEERLTGEEGQPIRKRHDYELEYPIEKIRIISKHYGFIKWLVENDKIDNKKIADETYVKVNGEWYELILGCHYDLYQQTLMLLSISDTPIEDLISYLK